MHVAGLDRRRRGWGEVQKQDSKARRAQPTGRSSPFPIMMYDEQPQGTERPTLHGGAIDWALWGQTQDAAFRTWTWLEPDEMAWISTAHAGKLKENRRAKP